MNRMRICGRNCTTLPTPPITPTANRLHSAPSGMNRSAEPLSQSKPAPMASISGRAQTKTDWKTMSITMAKTISPRRDA